jgi:glycosyltransferase involved in cell wall biosynthesis
MARVLVSVLIDTYNHECFIEEAISSVLAQDFPAEDREILVVDDGSTDRTPKILSKFATDIQILRKTNGGQGSAFNVGIPQCQGEIVAFLDGDDWWAPQKLSRVVQAMTVDPSVGIVGHGIINVQRDGSEMIETLREACRFQANAMEGALMFRRRGAFLGTSRMTIRANLLRRIGPVPAEIQIQADEYLFTLASVLMGTQILPDALTYYRLHAENRFQIDRYDDEKLRQKQKSLAKLVGALMQRLEELGVDSEVSRTVVAYTQASADQLRLALDGGWSWDTARTEWKVFRISHPDAGLSYMVFKSITLLAALFVPSRTFYRFQRTLAQSEHYRRVRERYLRFPEMEHIKKKWRARS